MAMSNFRERLRGDRAFRDRLMDELLISFATSSGLVDSDGNLSDALANQRVVAPRVVIAGRPLRHYFGQSEESLDRMGLTEEQKAEVRTHLNLGDGNQQQHISLGYNWPPEAPAPPQDQAMADESGVEHPSLLAWQEQQKQAEPDASQGQTGGEPDDDTPPADPAVATRSATPSDPKPETEGGSSTPSEEETAKAKTTRSRSNSGGE